MERTLGSIVEHLDPSRFEATILLRAGGTLLEHYRRFAPTHLYEPPATRARVRIARRLGRAGAAKVPRAEDLARRQAWARGVVTEFDPHLVVWHHNAAIPAFEPLADLPVPSVQTIAQHWSGVSRLGDDWLRAIASRSHYVCEGETSVANARFLLGVPADRISVVCIGPDLADRDRDLARLDRPQRRDLGIPDDAIVVATVGNLGLSKGTDLWLRAAAELRARHPDLPLRFLWLGGSPAEWATFRGEVLRTVTRDLGLDDVVVFAPQAAKAYPYYDLADIYVQPSRDDAFPGATLEAMSVGKPVVTFPIGIGAEEYARDALVRVDALDPSALAAGISRLVDDPDLRARLGAAGRTLVEERFDVVQSVRRYEEIFDRVAEQGRRADRSG
ncbi:MAG: glycosyltransferase family 4 protein [Acidimicrobiia bacterium]